MSSSAPSDSPPQIFDRARLLVNRQRSANGFYKHDFFHRQIASEISKRLALFNQDFKTAFCIGNTPLLRDALLKEEQIRFLYGNESLTLDEEHLPLAPASCDLIISFMGLHHCNDIIGALTQMRLALVPDGVFIAAMAGGQTLQELRAAFIAAETEILGGAHPHIHPFADLHDLGDILSRAGFALPVADSEISHIEYKDPQRLLYDLRGTGESNILFNRPKTFMRRDVLTRSLQHFQEGGSTACFEICYLTARAPHKDQQKPQKRGSATTSMAEALRRS